jgi:hypothetical protein
MIFRVLGISNYRNSRLAGKPPERLACMTLYTVRHEGVVNDIDKRFANSVAFFLGMIR